MDATTRFEGLQGRIRGMVVFTLAGRVDRDSIEDVCQTALLVIWQAMQKPENEHHTDSWFLYRANREAKDFLREYYGYRGRGHNVKVTEVGIEESHSMADAWEQTCQDTIDMHATLGMLDEVSRRVAGLFLMGYKQHQIAQVLRLSRQTIGDIAQSIGGVLRPA